ncbi:hypothetical protein SM0020_12335 [Sinorhizobium meliloti CCNWSX0020]|uniref:Uncharacterized protein n=1 Tax=Sinorhizobium meliloti CCNWSX0020 TaxID=1107881 RepID=H0FZ33_RHIML|nr:hypothetical protein [Sinorhizobium meliloti]EHK77713.1 hypothetical protein SM0020_12335 [Sinorhizobium meliloti CCNWSX0020]
MKHPVIPPALKVCEALRAQSKQMLDHELLVLNSSMVAIVVDIDGVDYIMTMTRVPKQRPRPTAQ